MKRAATTMMVLMVALVASAVLNTNADAALRSPQVPILGGSLQAYLNGIGESINVNTDQVAIQIWAHTTSATSAFTLQLENTPNAAVNDFGIYNGSDAVPALNMLIAGSNTPQGFASATFKPGNKLIVNRFDALANLLSTQTFLNVDPTGFGFWLSGPNGTFYTQDARNPGGKAQAVSFQGTGANAGTWWLCFEETSTVGNNISAGSDQDFDDCVVLMESVNPTPVSKTSWGQVKARFH
jgi:hypothetical protein